MRKPKVFLFDEPLSNLDAKMRVFTRTEISKLHSKLGATMVYVTHEQVEAMTMGDRICVMKDGHIMQVASPLELYNTPANMFVAGFIGSPPMNFFRGSIAKNGDSLKFVEHNEKATPVVITLDARLAAKAADYVGLDIVFGIRPEDVADTQTQSDADPNSVMGVTVDVSEPMGSETYLFLSTGATNFIARVSPTDRFETGQLIKITCDQSKAHLFDAETEQVIE